MINAQTGQQMEYIHDPDFRNFTLVEAELQQPQGAIFLAKMTTIKAAAATIEAAAVAVMVFSKIEGAAMTHDHAQVGIHVRKQLNVVEKQSVIVPRALSLDQVTVKDHRHELKRKLLCVKYTKRLMGSISRAVLGQLHDDKINRILAGQRRKSNRAAGGGKHRHHKRRIIVDVCGNCTAKDRQHERHPPRTQPSRRRHWAPFQQSLKQRTPLGGERNINIGLGGPGLPGNIRRGDG